MRLISVKISAVLAAMPAAVLPTALAALLALSSATATTATASAAATASASTAAQMTAAAADDGDWGGNFKAFPDSLLDEDHIYKYLFSDKSKSDMIMEEMRRRKTRPAWELDYIEGDMNYNTGQNHDALKFYNAALESPYVKGNDTLRMELLHRQISCYDKLHDEVNKMRCIGQLMTLAKEMEDKPMESIALFNMGKSLYYQGDKERGYKYMEQGAEMMAETDYRLKYDNLRYEYKTLAMFYGRDRRNGDALRILDSWEKIVSESSGNEPVIDGLAEREMKDLYAQRAVALSRSGRRNEARESYRRFCELDTNLSQNNYLIMPYLFDTGQYDEIFRITLPREQFLIGQKDTVNYYMASVLKFLGYACRDIGHYQRSSSYFERLAILRDSLKFREQKSAAQDYAALYGSKEKDLKIRQEQEENRMAWTIACGACLLLLAGGSFTVVIARKNKDITMKNATLTANLNRMVGYKDEVLRKQGEIMKLQEQMVKLSSLLPKEASGESNVTGTESLKAGEADSDRRTFDRIKYEIESNGLYLQKDFDKEAFAKRMSISSRKLAKLFTTFEGKPLSEYMQDLRLAHALPLLRDNPNWTIDAVAENCCMSLRTFHRLFTRKFGITPQVYQKGFGKDRQQ